jgi:hypothetical protein
MDFTQAQAAKLSLLEERNFRVLVDEGSVLATEETRKFGRGKAKLYSRNEVRIASVLSALNVRATSLRPKIGEWLREGDLEKSSRLSIERPIYIIVEDGNTTGRSALWYQSAFDDWDPADLVPFLGKKKPKDRLISVMVEDKGGRRPLNSFVAASLADALRWDRWTEEELAKRFEPSTELDKIFEGLRP